MKILGRLLIENNLSPEVDCEINGVLKNSEGEWVCNLILRKPIEKTLNIRALDEAAALHNALSFIINLIK
ncbi:hypothetical protein GCM10007881_07790 [Mesorhizobium huakuii]|nr:hypothetical protein GCM10007881_07790 [Mesorhizobium huakuii]